MGQIDLDEILGPDPGVGLGEPSPASFTLAVIVPRSTLDAILVVRV
jgi:hypothetical protein